MRLESESRLIRFSSVCLAWPGFAGMDGPPGVTDGAEPLWVFWFNPLKEALTPVIVVCKSGPGVFAGVDVGGLTG